MTSSPYQSFRRPLFVAASSATSLATTKLRAAYTGNAYGGSGFVPDAADAAQEYLVEAVAALGVAMAQDPEQYLTAFHDKARTRINKLIQQATATTTSEEPQ